MADHSDLAQVNSSSIPFIILFTQLFCAILNSKSTCTLDDVKNVEITSQFASRNTTGSVATFFKIRLPFQFQFKPIQCYFWHTVVHTLYSTCSYNNNY